MKLCIFSDIHGNQYAFNSFIKEIYKRDIDHFYFLGDVFGYYYGQNECLDILRDMPHLTCIRGNHEVLYYDALKNPIMQVECMKKYGSSYGRINDISEDNKKFLSTWIDMFEIEMDGIKIGFFHGSPRQFQVGRVYPDTIIDDMVEFAKYDVVFLGHTHHKMHRKYRNTEIYNPGSLGQQRDGKGCSYTIYDTFSKKASWHTVQYDIEALANEVRENDSDKLRFIEVLYR